MGIKKNSVAVSWEFDYEDPQTLENFHIKCHQVDIGPVVEISTIPLTSDQESDTIMLSASMFAEITDLMRERKMIDSTATITESPPQPKRNSKRANTSIATESGNLPTTMFLSQGKSLDRSISSDDIPTFDLANIPPVENFDQFGIPESSTLIKNSPTSNSTNGDEPELPLTKIVSSDEGPSLIEMQQEESGDEIISRPVMRGINSTDQASALRGFDPSRMISRKE